MGLFSLTQEIAVDLGTANTIIIHNNKIVVDEPSYVALDSKGRLVAVGEQAKMMQGKEHSGIRTIRPLRSVASRLLREKTSRPHDLPVDLSRDRRGLRLSREDVQAFSRQLERDFSYLSERYFLTLAHEPTVRVTRDRITVTFDISKEE